MITFNHLSWTFILRISAFVLPSQHCLSYIYDLWIYCVELINLTLASYDIYYTNVPKQANNLALVVGVYRGRIWHECVYKFPCSVTKFSLYSSTNMAIHAPGKFATLSEQPRYHDWTMILNNVTHMTMRLCRQNGMLSGREGFILTPA